MLQRKEKRVSEFRVPGMGETLLVEVPSRLNIKQTNIY